jgi:hypothetical protein
LTSPKPIADAQGRIAVIVDFVDDAEDAFSDQLSQSAKAKPHFKRGLSFHRAQTSNLVDRYEHLYGFSHIGMTSHVGASFTAFLDEKQIEKLRKDKNVRLITQDAYGEAASSLPPWYDNPQFPNGANETHSWGRSAVNGKDKIPGTARRVYVIDSGVGYHDDLNSVVTRTNVHCGAQGGCENTSPVYQVVGCYPHATHVAGIISATNGNQKTSSGVYAGVDLVSVTTRRGYSTAAPCALGDQTKATVGYALDYVKDQVCANNGGQVGVVNISMNGDTTAVGWTLDANNSVVAETNKLKLEALARPILPPLRGKDSRCRRYPGALVVQSAGNHNLDVCTISAVTATWTATPAYVPQSGAGGTPGSSAVSNDGIMVVGAIRSDGSIASTFSASNPSNIGVSTPPGTNFGACVDVWAPGDNILSTWGSHSPSETINSVQYSGNAPNLGQGWAFISGTSMAAPHVAAAAAYLADAFNITDSIALEQRVRLSTQVIGGRAVIRIP